MRRTRIKICGLTRPEDVSAAVALGADALGFVFYPRSPRYRPPEVVARLITTVPPFVTTVGLFVNSTPQEVQQTVVQAPVSLLQFHGDETPEQCAETAALVNRPFVSVLRVRPETTGADLLEYASRCRAASSLFAGLLLDTHVESYGGSGKAFNWSIIPEELAPQVVLSGGLDAQNATDAVARVRPHAVDVSSGVERMTGGNRLPGIKDAARMVAFVAAVRAADASLADSQENFHE